MLALVGSIKYIAIFALIVLFIAPSSHAQTGGLSKENVQAYYTTMVASNTELRPGFEDLPVWLAFLEDNLAEDYEGHSYTLENCKTEAKQMEVLDKPALLNIYNTVGVNRYKRFEMNVHEIKISDDRKRADVSFILIADEYGAGQEFNVSSQCTGEHIWNDEKQRAQVRKISCTERIVTDAEDSSCQYY